MANMRCPFCRDDAVTGLKWSESDTRCLACSACATELIELGQAQGSKVTVVSMESCADLYERFPDWPYQDTMLAQQRMQRDFRAQHPSRATHPPLTWRQRARRRVNRIRFETQRRTSTAWHALLDDLEDWQ